MRRGVRGGYFGVSEGCFADEIWGSGEARMGRFAAEFCGFLGGARVRRGDSAHGGHGWVLGAKKFLKKGWKTQKLGCERCRKAVQGRTI